MIRTPSVSKNPGVMKLRSAAAVAIFGASPSTRIGKAP
jgi:hypothetical protein